MKAYIHTKYDSDKRENILEKKVVISSRENRWQIMKINPDEICDWEECNVKFQPERLNPEVTYYGKTAIVKDGLCYMDDGSIYDPSQFIGECDSPTPENK